LLISAGANINAENSWKITPINLAMMKNRRTCVNELLD
jgi:ankyrin repeat protein